MENLIRAPIGDMVCALPIGIVILLVSFLALRITVGKYLSDDKDKTKIGLNYGIVAIICFLITWVAIVNFLQIKAFATLTVPISHLFIFNSIAIYFITSRPSLKSFVILKLPGYRFPFQNTVHVQSI